MAGENSSFATISEAEILKIQEDAVPENTKKATKSVIEITEWVYTNNCPFQSWSIAAEYWPSCFVAR